MEYIKITGQVPLKGEITIEGAKNAALGIIPATILAKEACYIENLPDIQDIRNYLTIIKKLGGTYEKQDDGSLMVDTANISLDNLPLIEKEATEMRASYYLLGSLLSRFSTVTLPLPGGCDIGARPIDQHIKGFECLGAKVEIKNGYIKVEAEKLKGANIMLDMESVGATINILLASVLCEGVTIIENAAKEPHVVDVANCLNMMGANIKGAGTDTIKITGVEKLHGCRYAVVPDQITTGTYMIAAAATKGDLLIKNVIPKHMEVLSSKLLDMGHQVIEYDDSIRVIGCDDPKPVKIKTSPYPGFPTDLQQPMGVLLALANGKGSITESIFENRFKYVHELNKMGADIQVVGNTAIFTGVKELQAAKIKATDLRAGAAMVIAALAANGTSEITDIFHIDRGYEDIVGKLKKAGATIERITE